jgi:hypothetical protein
MFMDIQDVLYGKIWALGCIALRRKAVSAVPNWIDAPIRDTGNTSELEIVGT